MTNLKLSFLYLQSSEPSNTAFVFCCSCIKYSYRGRPDLQVLVLFVLGHLVIGVWTASTTVGRYCCGSGPAVFLIGVQGVWYVLRGAGLRLHHRCITVEEYTDTTDGAADSFLHVCANASLFRQYMWLWITMMAVCRNIRWAPKIIGASDTYLASHVVCAAGVPLMDQMFVYGLAASC